MHLTKTGLLVAGLAAGAYAIGHALPGRGTPAIVDVRSATTARTSAERGPAASASEPATPPQRITVFVAGDVRRPGVYALAAGSRIVDAYRSAGGAAVDADPVAIDLAAPVRDGQEIVVPRRGERVAAPAAIAESGASPDDATAADATPAPRRHRHRHKRRRRRAAAADSADAAPASEAADAGAAPSSGDATATTVVAINAASAADLETLPGIGPALAERIVRYRELNGPFASAAELADVAGMTSGKIDALAPLVRF